MKQSKRQANAKDKSMKILLLSCNTGDGHNKAAHAIAEAFTQNGAHCILRDPVSFGGTAAMRLASSSYNAIIRKAPCVFGAIYQIGRAYSDRTLPSPVYAANALYARHLAAYINEVGFDAVIATHLYGMEALTAIRRSGIKVRAASDTAHYAD